jgi:hypothetical protein
MSTDKELEKLKSSLTKLYDIDADCPKELRQAIGILRQLLNEEYNPSRPVTSQFIYDIIYPAIHRHQNQLRQELRTKLKEYYGISDE